MIELPKLSAEQFSEFFETLHGHCPFPWQRMLLKQCASEKGWPDLIDLPTASGKTACIDVAIFLLALQASKLTHERTAARRIWFVVDRRIVVDEAYERAMKIAYKLRDAKDGILATVATRLKCVNGTRLPLAVARLRGGAPKQLAWSYHPAQAAVITSTVDQIGSRLLFRGYGVGKHSRSIHAALAGNDSLIILDEAHTANAFRQTADWCKHLREEYTEGAQESRSPFHLVTMSATPLTEDGREQAVFPEPQDRTEALRHDLLNSRYDANKPAELVEVGKLQEKSDPLVKEAAERAVAFAGQHRRTGVMVNRVATATAIAEALRADGKDAFDVILLTGRMRPIDRDELVGKWSKFLTANKPETPGKPIILVTTQCLEVGADFSFDALVTQCASLDALRQRFGRLNRLGDNPDPALAVILIRQGDHKEDVKLDEAKPLDPIYGNALSRTWNWLNVHADTPAGGSGKKKVSARIDMGIKALAEKMESTKLDSAAMQPLLAPAPNAPILLPAYLDLFCQTGPEPEIEPNVALFLHGPQRDVPEVSVVFRQDLDPDDSAFWADTVELMPPVAGEKLSVPLWRLKQFLVDQLGEDTTGDMESEWMAEQEPPRARQKPKDFVIFRGKSDVQHSDQADQIERGDTIVFPAPEQFPSRLGTPGERKWIDVYEQAYQQAHGWEVQRIHERVMRPEWDRDTLDLAYVRNEPLDKDALCAAIGSENKKEIRFLDYPDGRGRILIFPQDKKAAESELDPFAFDEAKLLENDRAPCDETLLESHTQRVEEQVVDMATPCVNASLLEFLKQAARLHDLGKADQRFQRLLNNGRRFGATQLLAKSRKKIAMARWKELRTLVGLPEHFRHEMLSMQMAAAIMENEPCRDLLLHLIAAHHGYARPFAPVSVDESPPDVDLLLGGKTYSITGTSRQQVPPHRLDSGIAERFWRLNRQYGWWGLAYLESLLRLADWRASRAMEEGGFQ